MFRFIIVNAKSFWRNILNKTSLSAWLRAAADCRQRTWNFHRLVHQSRDSSELCKYNCRRFQEESNHSHTARKNYALSKRRRRIHCLKCFLGDSLLLVYCFMQIYSLFVLIVWWFNKQANKIKCCENNIFCLVPPSLMYVTELSKQFKY